MTAEAVNAGAMKTGSKKSLTRLLFLSALRAELLDYASGTGIQSGSLFTVPYIISTRREGDIPVCYANADKVSRVLV